MQEIDRHVTADTDSAPLAAGRHDLSLSGLTPGAREALSALACPWFNSLAFGEGYADPPASRVVIWVDQDGRIARALPYTERRWLGCWRALHGLGPAALETEEAMELLRARRAQVLTVHRMPAPAAGPSPWRRTVTRVSEDFVMTLAETSEAYLASLGSRTRQQTPQHLRRLQREWGEDFHVDFALDDAIDLAACAELVAMNRSRRTARGARHLWTDALLERRVRLARRHGVFCAVRRGETLVAGTLSYLDQGEAYTAVIGHDMAFEKLHVGKIALWMTIERMIALGVRRHHLLWGWSPYKTRFGAVEEPLYDDVVFRHGLAAACWHLGWLLSHLRPWLKAAVATRLGEARFNALRAFVGRALARRQAPEARGEMEGSHG